MKNRCINYLLLIALILSIGGLYACSDNRAAELFKTAEFEELQNNSEHALQLYEEILSKHPNSKYAQQAEARRNAINSSKQAQ